MKTTIQIVTGVLCIVASAHAQQAVQWKVSDGGNGHWYRIVTRTTACWDSVRLEAEGIGGYLATLVSPQEDAWVRSQLPDVPWYFIGGRQQPDACEPGCGWYWVTGEPFVPMWDSSQPDGDLPWTVPQDILTTYRRGWHDGPDCGDPTVCGGGCPFGGFIVEWSADCNNDGIVDYGQCRDGSLADYNGNNVPDCCERGETCVVGNYPVQWRTEDGGNGHWYQRILFAGTAGCSTCPPYMCQATAADYAQQRGAFLVSIGSLAEGAFAGNVTNCQSLWTGLTLSAGDGCDIFSWNWSDGTEVRPEVMASGSGGNWCTTWEFACDIRGGQCAPWALENLSSCWPDVTGLMLEWSADCNSDGIVDYGQILQGQLADLDINGIPDICQQPTCVDADIFRDFNVNGADLGILLSQWGPSSPLTVSDINSDGVVNGADLGILLSYWGECP